MADKQRGFIADNIRVTPKRYDGTVSGDISIEDAMTAVELTIDVRGLKDSYIARNNAISIFNALKDGFDWSRTNEGHDYWSIVAGALYRISREGR